MRSPALLALALLISISNLPSFAAPAPKPAEDAEVSEEEVPATEDVDEAAAAKIGKTIKGGYEYVVCVESTSLNVRNNSLRNVLFNVKRFEKVKLFQGWGENSKQKAVHGKKHTFVRVQFPTRENKGQSSVGWIAKGFIRAKSDCGGAVAEEKKIIEKQERQEAARPVAPVTPKINVNHGSVAGDDTSTWEFPLNTHPDRGILDRGMWNFGWNRSHGRRTHAACDLYHNRGDAVVAVSPGVVVRDLYYFYENTYALEVRHSNGFVVRYGEVLGRKADGVSGGRRVSAGQTVGFMGKTSHPNPMLHFEMYSGKASGSLSGHGNKYQRRSDLMNPTPYLVKWEDAKFRDRK